jgi:hypothetical protein
VRSHRRRIRGTLRAAGFAMVHHGRHGDLLLVSKCIERIPFWDVFGYLEVWKPGKRMVKEQHAKPGMLGHIHMIIECLSSMPGGMKPKWLNLMRTKMDQWTNVAIVTPKLLS